MKRSISFPMNNLSQLPCFWVVIPAAGVGSRMGAAIPKQYMRLGDLTILEHTLNCFLAHPQLLGIVVCLSKDDPYWLNLAISKNTFVQVAEGGKERAESVLSGLQYLSNQANPNDWVLVHDAARPNLCREDLDKLLCVAGRDSIGGILASPARDTLKQIDEQGRVKKTLDRSMIWQALTPQMFRLQQLMQALQQAHRLGVKVTDEASAIESMGYSPLLIEGRSDNLKVTHPEDIQRLTPYFINN